MYGPHMIDTLTQRTRTMFLSLHTRVIFLQLEGSACLLSAMWTAYIYMIHKPHQMRVQLKAVTKTLMGNARVMGMLESSSVSPTATDVVGGCKDNENHGPVLICLTIHHYSAYTNLHFCQLQIYNKKFTAIFEQVE